MTNHQRCLFGCAWFRAEHLRTDKSPLHDALALSPSLAHLLCTTLIKHSRSEWGCPKFMYSSNLRWGNAHGTFGDFACREPGRAVSRAQARPDPAPDSIRKSMPVCHAHRTRYKQHNSMQGRVGCRRSVLGIHFIMSTQVGIRASTPCLGGRPLHSAPVHPRLGTFGARWAPIDGNRTATRGSACSVKPLRAR